MPRSTAAERARQHLVEGRVAVTFARDEVLSAIVRGSGAHHRVTHDPEREWQCSCKAGTYKGSCSHVQAVQLVTAPVRTWETE